MSGRNTTVRTKDIIGYVFPNRDQDSLWNALQGPGDSHFDNRVMTIGGDGILKLILVEDLETSAKVYYIVSLRFGYGF